MLFKQQPLRLTWLIAALASTLMLSGCFSDSDNKGIVLLDNPKVGSGEVFHGAEWATIKDLDPRGEQCVECHGLNADMSPYRNGAMAHNIGLQKNTDHSAYTNLKITGVKIDEASGKVTVTLNKPIPDRAGALSMTFAKLVPRVIHNRGHDWQNYFVSNAFGFGENRTVQAQGKESMMLQNGGVQPQTVPNPKVSGNTITFNLGDGDGRSWGKQNFTVESAYIDDGYKWEYEDVLGTKFGASDWDIAKHSTCEKANTDANQLEASLKQDGANPVCWWPDGTHLTSGVFVTNNNEFVVAYEPDYTHRVTVIIAGQPGFNTWYDFVPSVANGDKTVADLNLPVGSPKYIESNGHVDVNAYTVAKGNAQPDGFGASVTEHQKFPAARDVVDVQSCNSCHDSLSMHGGARSQTQTCVTCHNPGNLQASSGRSVDFKQLIHRIHRGANLPSEAADIAGLMDAADANKPAQSGSLVATFASDFTKVRFPQGPTPGSAAGITNCVKCHMGPETKAMVQGLADELGADHFDVQSEMKLAKVTPQGDNWLSVRTVNACQACHDSNVWFSDNDDSGSRGKTGISALNAKRSTDSSAKDPNAAENKLDKYLPFYTAAYSSIGFDWLGKKLSRNESAGWIHNTGNPAGDKGRNDRFSCGSSGGCHGNSAITGLTVENIGNRTSNAIQQVHLELTRNYILAERFSIDISNAKVAKNSNDQYEFTADIKVLDKRNDNTPVNVIDNGNAFELDIADAAFANYRVLGPALPGGRNLFTGYLGWMNNSPDYNHSLGHAGDDFTEIPGGAADAPITWTDNSDTGTIKINLETLPNQQWDSIKNNLSNVVGTLVVRGSLGNFPATLSLKTATQDIRFDNSDVADDGRRQVVDFLAGQGNDANRDRYAGWDKEHGSNTQSCSSCHLQLAMHAGVTNNVQACVVCHNPQRTDLNSRTKRGTDLAANSMVKLGIDGQYEESLDLKRLIHGIHSAGDKFRKDTFTAYGLAVETFGKDKGNSFPGKLDNCKSCHIQDEDSGQWTFELTQLPRGMIGSTAITADWSTLPFKIDGGAQHDLSNHLKMSPIASVCSSCHDAGYKTSEGRMNNNILDGGPYVGSHWWVMGGIAPGIVRPGEAPSSTKHQSGKL